MYLVFVRLDRASEDLWSYGVGTSGYWGFIEGGGAKLKRDNNAACPVCNSMHDAHGSSQT